MLESIHIEKIALIKNLDISLSCGFTAFTGETGAGKSIIIDSVAIISGGKFTRELIRKDAEYALVEAIFSDMSKQTLLRCEELGVTPDEDGYLYISRKITPDGKSLCRINSKQVPLSLLRELSAFLINIHGQHDNQDLLKKEKHINILDSYAGAEKELNDYKLLYSEYKSLKKEYEDVSLNDAEKQRNIEMLKFQIEEISSLKLKVGEEEKLTEEKKRLANTEKISDNAQRAYGVLYANNLSAVENIDTAITSITNLAKISDGFDAYIESLSSARSEIYDIAEYMRELCEDAEENPSERLDRIEKRLYDIYKLKRKYGNSIEEVLEYLEKAKNTLSNLELSDIRKEELERLIKTQEEKLLLSAQNLSNKRQNGADTLNTRIEEELSFLEMEKVKFLVSFKEKPFSSDGIDEVEFLVKANVGLDYSPLSKTASGGELSRLMLGIKSVIAEKDGVETIIFDEVDTGISGKTSRKIGIKLLNTSETSQVMCVTHSAQIASLSDTHIKVEKYEENGTTFTKVKPLNHQERIDETARIISGIDITANAKNAALELINDAKNYKK